MSLQSKPGIKREIYEVLILKAIKETIPNELINSETKILINPTGEFVKGGDKNSWGNKDRDALSIDYEASYEVEIKYPVSGQPDNVKEYTYKTSDILVVRDRGVKPEWFTAVVNE